MHDKSRKMPSRGQAFLIVVIQKIVTATLFSKRFITKARRYEITKEQC